jgi:hypothetical protein
VTALAHRAVGLGRPGQNGCWAKPTVPGLGQNVGPTLCGSFPGARFLLKFQTIV